MLHRVFTSVGDASISVVLKLGFSHILIMTKAKFFILPILCLISLTACQTETQKNTPSVSGNYAPKSLTGLKIQFITYKVNDRYNQEFLKKTAAYQFSKSNEYRLFLSGKLHSSGYYAYKQQSENTGVMTLSYSSYSGMGDYSVLFTFKTKTSGTMKASSHGSDIADFEATFKVL